MKKNTDTALRRIYRQNPETGAFLIEVALDRYEEVFNEWDPAPYKRRDLNPDLRRYLEDSSADIPLRQPVEILFQAPEKIQTPDKEARAREGISTYLSCLVDSVGREFQRLYRTALIYLGAAVCLLTATAYMTGTGQDSLLITVIRDGLTIGSWVFTWELISLFFFQRFDLHRERKKWSRLARAEVHFSYVSS